MAIGANCFSLFTPEALRRSLEAGLEATWPDNCGVRSDEVSEKAHHLSQILIDHPNHTSFGSVAFKYQKVEHNPSLTARRAFELGFTPTTSKLATGSAPDIAKIQAMRELLEKDAPLALASGVTPDNVQEFAPFVSDILISTGVSSDFYHFDEKLLNELMDKVRQYEASTKKTRCLKRLDFPSP